MLAPHDETFTIQPWFKKQIPSVFVYEAPDAARSYVRGGRAQHSDHAKTALLVPGPYDIIPDGGDILGAILISDKAGQVPFYCGIEMFVKDALVFDPSGSVTPTAFQVVGGVWCALLFTLTHDNLGEKFPEDLPTDFVMSRVFPYSGRLVTRSVPEMSKVIGCFDPSADNALDLIMGGIPKAVGNGTTHFGPGNGNANATGKTLFATTAFAAGAAIVQLTYTGSLDVDVRQAVGHSCDPNAYVDRNRTLRAWKDIAANEAISVDYRLFFTATDNATKLSCACGAKSCCGDVTNWTTIPIPTVRKYLESAPVNYPFIADVRSYFAAPKTA
jgi:hypothetical protein